MRKILLHIILLFLIFSLPGVSQTPFFKIHPLDEAFNSAVVDLIYEDNHTFLWVGSSEGLFQYDGSQFTQFLKPDHSSNVVTAIFQDRSNKLWVGYEDGSIAHLLNRKLEIWNEIDTISSPINGITEDKDGHIWIATYGEGIFYVDQHRYENISVTENLLSNDIYVMYKDLDEQIWLGTDGGINICSFKNGELDIKQLTKEDGLPDEIVKTLLQDKDGNMWIGMFDKGTCLFNMKNQTFEYTPTDFKGGEVSCLEIFDNQEVWIGTNGNGVWRYNLKTQGYTSLSNAKDKVYDLHKDTEGNIWVLANQHGICQTNRQFEFLPTDFNNIQSVLFDANNLLWIGTQDGLFTYNQNQEPIFSPRLSNLALNVLSLYEDKFGIIWIGTFGDGVYCYDPKSTQIKHLTEKEGLSNNSVISIDGQNGHIWLATLGGVTEFEISDNIFNIKNPRFHQFSKESGLGTNYTYKVFIDSKERVWFTSDGNGVSVLDKGQFINYTHATIKHENDSLELIPLKAVYSITEDLQNNIWLSTADQGIFEIDGTYFTQLALKEGIRDLEITSLIRDKKGNILIIHPSGIDILDPLTQHLIYYDDEVGITEIEPNLNAVCTDSYGNIWIGGQSELIKYTPLAENLEIHPRTFINQVSIFLEPVKMASQSVFPHDQNNMVFDYKGIWYTDPTTVKYRYRLEGYDHSWILSSDTRATYSNLPSGQYAFQVMSTENDAFSHEPIASYEFEILTPIWKRWWFILLASLIGLALYRWYLKTRDARLQKVNLLKKERAESQLQAIKAQINPHFLFNSFNTLIAIIEDDRALAVEYVENLSDFYRCILQYRNKEIIPIQEELDIINKYSFLIKKRYGDQFNLDIQLNGEPLYVAPFTLQALVENAVKHNVISKKQPLHVEVGLYKGNFIEVKNNLQKKKEKPKSTAFGLQSIAQRYELMTLKKIEIVVTADEFKVRIPVIKS